jgi:SH3-like domain-containing protein
LTTRCDRYRAGAHSSTGIRAIVLVAGVVAVLAAATISSGPLHAQSGPGATQPYGVGATGLPLPRFVSLKSDRVQVRQGPGTDHKVLWVFSRVGLPVEIMQEFENWRQIRDQDGSVGWVAHALLSARRTAVVLAWAAGQQAKGTTRTVPLHVEASTSANSIALLEPGVVCDIRNCDGRWCNVSVGDYRGYIEQAKLWGVYPGEAIK